MDKKVSKSYQKEKPNWDWTHVQCYLKTVQSNRKTSIWNLSPGIILTNPSTDSSGPSVRLYIDTQKSLQYSNDLGWNWHKSWNIPNISLRLQIKDQNTGDFLLAPRNLYAQIFAVKRNSQNEKIDRTTLIDVGIRGESKMEMIDGQVYFSAIKFSSTTYNNQGVNFNMLIVLYIKQGEFQRPKVLTAVISPPIFVDSRRSARDYQQKKFSSFVEPFNYDCLDKQFIKRENKSKCESQIIIKNDPEGFYNYITAPNIRHKVKHPVFLAIKFSNCVKIYYNTKTVNATQITELLQNMQSKLLKEGKNKQKNDLQLGTNFEEKSFVFVISNLTDSLKRKKVIESIETMQNEFIGIACGTEDLPQSMMPFSPIESIKKAYKECYDNLIAICQNYEPEDQDESDQYYSDQFEDSSKSSGKKKRSVEAPRTRNKTTIISNKKEANGEKQKQAKIEKNQEIILKKQELFDSQFQAPVFFNPENPQARRNNTSSAFSKAVGFRNVTNPIQNNNTPIFDTSQLNKAFSNNMGNVSFQEPTRPANQGFKSTTKQQPNVLINQNNQQTAQPQATKPIQPQQPAQSTPSNLQNRNQNQQNQQNQQNNQNPQMSNNFMGGQYGNNSVYNNLMYGNMALSNYLQTVKTNNNGLYDGMVNPTISDQMMHKSNLQRFIQSQQHQKMLEMGRMPLQNEDQQSIVCLLQQIGLYKQLLAQISYQNQLLSRDISIKQQGPMPHQFGGGMNLNNYMNMQGIPGNMDHNNTMNSAMGGMGSLSGMSGLGSMGNMGNMGNFNSMMNSNTYGYQGNLLNGQMGMSGGLLHGHGREQSGQQGQQQHGQQHSQNSQQPQQPQPSKQAQSKLPPHQPQSNSNPQPQQPMLNLSNLSSLSMNGNINSSNYEIIKNMVLEDLKREAEQKERDRQSK